MTDTQQKNNTPLLLVSSSLQKKLEFFSTTPSNQKNSTTSQQKPPTPPPRSTTTAIHNNKKSTYYTEEQPSSYNMAHNYQNDNYTEMNSYSFQDDGQQQTVQYITEPQEYQTITQNGETYQIINQQINEGDTVIIANQDPNIPVDGQIILGSENYTEYATEEPQVFQQQYETEYSQPPQVQPLKPQTNATTVIPLPKKRVYEKMDCPVCKGTYSGRANLRNHMKAVHKLTNEEMQQMLPYKVPPKSLIQARAAQAAQQQQQQQQQQTPGYEPQEESISSNIQSPNQSSTYSAQYSAPSVPSMVENQGNVQVIPLQKAEEQPELRQVIPGQPRQTADNKIECPLCQKLYTGRANLRSHMKLVHKLNVEERKKYLPYLTPSKKKEAVVSDTPLQNEYYTENSGQQYLSTTPVSTQSSRPTIPQYAISQSKQEKVQQVQYQYSSQQPQYQVADESNVQYVQGDNSYSQQNEQTYYYQTDQNQYQQQQPVCKYFYREIPTSLFLILISYFNNPNF